MRSHWTPALAAGLALTAITLAGCSDEPEAAYEVDQTAGEIGGIDNQASLAQQDRTAAAPAEQVQVTEASGLGALEIQRQLPEQIYQGQPFQYTLEVTNTSDMTLHDIHLRELYRDQLRPAGQQAQGPQNQQQQAQQQQQQGQVYGFPRTGSQASASGQTHQLGMLGPGETQQIQATAVPTAEGELKLCVLADYAMAQCSTINVIQPELQLQRTVVDSEGNPVDRAYACEEIFVVYKVTNAGTGETGTITITEPLAQGFQTEDGQNRIQLELEGLAADESTTTDPIRISAQQAGTLSGTATAKTDRLQATAGGDSPVQIMKPQIAMQIDGPQTQFLGRTIRYNVAVRNTSQFPAPETVVELDLPDDAQQVSVSSQQIQHEGDEFTLGTLDPGATRNFSVEFKPSDVGQLTIQGVANAYCAAAAQGQVQTMVQGVPALQIEAVDAQDPIDVGGQTTYDITVINEGSARDTQITLTGQLEEGLTFVSGEGDSDVRSTGEGITFGQIESLEPGEDANWTVTVEGAEATRSRLRLELKSGAIARPVIEVEPTNIY